MKIMIVGAGQVGTTVMEEFFPDYSITMVDRNSDVLDEVPFDIDVYAGDALKRSTLQEAGLATTDVLIATTTDDQTNLLVCNMATALEECYTLARVSDPSYVQTWEQSPGAFGVDVLIGRANLTAEEITTTIGLQSRQRSVLDESMFCQGSVKMSEFRLEAESPLVGQTIENVDGEHDITFGAVIRDGDLHFARGNAQLKEGDRIAVFGEESKVDAFGRDRVHPGESGLHQTVDILGGGNIGYQTGVLLEPTDLSVRIFERDPERADYLARSLPDSMVLDADVTQRKVWEEESIPDTELILHSTGIDERNLLTTHLAIDFGASRNISIVDEQQYVPIFESLDITRAVHPREVVATNITRSIEESYAETVTMLGHEKAEVFEARISPESSLVGRSLNQLIEDLPGPFVVGAVARGSRVIAPRGDTVLEPGDSIVVVAPGERAEALADQL